MINFVKMTKLTNVSGRADYISNTDRQESIIVMSDSVDWKPYREYEQNNRKSLAENNEARELIIALPNEWTRLGESVLAKHVQVVAEKAIGKNTDLQWAVHLNKSRSNLHVHVIFSERKLIHDNKNNKVYDRDIYLTSDGKVARKKSDRAKDKHGNINPPVHRKGEKKNINCGFTVKNPEYKSKKWLESVKNELKEHFKTLGFEYEEGHFHQYHEGKGKESHVIQQKNKIIKDLNIRFEKWVNLVKVPNNKELHLKIKKDAVNIINTGNIPVFRHKRNNQGKITNYWIESKTPQEWEKIKENLTGIQPKRENPLSESSETPKPSEPLTPFDPAAVVKARDRYVEIYLQYVYKCKNDVDTAVINKPNLLKRAIDELQRTERKVRLYKSNLTDCNIFQIKKKKEIITAINEVSTRCEEIANEIQNYGVTIYFENLPLDRNNVSKERVDEIIRLATKFEIPKLERGASAELEKQKFLNSIGHVENTHVNAAKIDFIKLAGKVPSEHQESVYNALQTHYRASFKSSPADVVKVNEEISQIIKKNALKPPSKSKQELKVTKTSENKEKTTRPRGRGR